MNGILSELRDHAARWQNAFRTKLPDKIRVNTPPDPTDPITGLMTAKPFMKFLKKNWRESGVLLLIEPQQIEHVRESEGNAAADQLMDTIASRINVCVRDTDPVARIGQNLFGVYLMGAERILALRIATRLAKTIPLPAHPETRVALAIGGAELVSAENPTHLIEQATAAMSASSPEHPRFFPRLTPQKGPAAHVA